MSWHHRRLDRKRWERVRREVLDRDGWRCVKCYSYGHEVDHIQPLHKGGAEYDPANLQVLCGGPDGCHARKTALENGGPETPGRAEWRAMIDEIISKSP